MSDSLTALLEKENLGLRDMQAFHRELDRVKGFDQDVLHNIAYLTGEVGELVGAIREHRKKKGLPEEMEAHQHIGEELADCLAYILKLANCAEIDLHGAYLEKMRRNMNRVWRKSNHKEHEDDSS